MTTTEFWLACGAVVALCLGSFKVMDWWDAKRQARIERLMSAGNVPEPFELKASECHRVGERRAL